MAANTILTSIVTGGTNSHATVAEEANSISTDFVTQGVVGAITLNTGSAGAGSFCVNADSSPDMGVTIKAGQAYITATPAGQNSQVLRARAATDYTTYTINANASGSTKYDWIYLSVSATNANTPSASADNVTSIVTSRSSSNATDNGSPPTYGLLLAIVTVANAASSITNSNITDRRFNTSIGAQNGSLIVTQSGTGVDAKIQAAGIDANVNLRISPKGTGRLQLDAVYNPYKFRVTRQAAAASGNSAFAKIVFDTETYDTNNNFATGTYTVSVAGFYQFNSVLQFASASNDIVVSLFKNGTEYSRGTRMKGAASVTSGGVSDLIQCAISDTIEIWAFGSNNSLDLATANNYFSGFLVSAT